MVKYCPECGKENSDSSEFCENCGEKLPQSTGTPTGFGSPTFSDEKSQVKKSSNTKIAIVLAGLCWSFWSCVIIRIPVPGCNQLIILHIMGFNITGRNILQGGFNLQISQQLGVYNRRI
ncbi:MAG TPA: zinc ribbon domain-containing protein [Methanobacterium sp.]|nr:zinc ribbon domain-containing protein [Methanobacterium sp.]